MTRVIADQGIKVKFKDFSEVLEVCDESGKLVGYFQPVPVHDREVYDWAKAEFAKEDLTEARQSTVWYTTEEVLEHLRSL
jgi:hypothetical protein